MQYYSLQHRTLLSPPDTCTTGHRFHFGSVFSDLLFSSPIVYWTPINLGGYLSVLYLSTFSYCLWGSQGKNAEMVCHSPFQCAILSELISVPFSSGHFVCHGWPYMAWLTVSLSYTKLWSVWSFWLVFCGCGFHSFCPLIDEDNRLVQVSWREGLAVGKTRSFSCGQHHAQ